MFKCLKRHYGTKSLYFPPKQYFCLFSYALRIFDIVGYACIFELGIWYYYILDLNFWNPYVMHFVTNLAAAIFENFVLFIDWLIYLFIYLNERFYLYPLWRYQKTRVLLMFSGEIELKTNICRVRIKSSLFTYNESIFWSYEPNICKTSFFMSCFFPNMITLK